MRRAWVLLFPLLLGGWSWWPFNAGEGHTYKPVYAKDVRFAEDTLREKVTANFAKFKHTVAAPDCPSPGCKWERKGQYFGAEFSGESYLTTPMQHEFIPRAAEGIEVTNGTTIVIYGERVGVPLRVQMTERNLLDDQGKPLTAAYINKQPWKYERLIDLNLSAKRETFAALDPVTQTMLRGFFPHLPSINAKLIAQCLGRPVGPEHDPFPETISDPNDARHSWGCDVSGNDDVRGYHRQVTFKETWQRNPDEAVP